MHNFLYLILEAFLNQRPKVSRRASKIGVSKGNWRSALMKNKKKGFLSKKSPMLSSRRLASDTKKTRIAWDPEGYKGVAKQKFTDDIYKRI